MLQSKLSSMVLRSRFYHQLFATCSNCVHTKFAPSYISMQFLIPSRVFQFPVYFLMVWYLVAVANHIAWTSIHLSNHSFCFKAWFNQCYLQHLDTFLVIVIIHHTAMSEISFLFFLPSTALWFWVCSSHVS